MKKVFLLAGFVLIIIFLFVFATRGKPGSFAFTSYVINNPITGNTQIRSANWTTDYSNEQLIGNWSGERIYPVDLNGIYNESGESTIGVRVGFYVKNQDKGGIILVIDCKKFLEDIIASGYKNVTKKQLWETLSNQIGNINFYKNNGLFTKTDDYRLVFSFDIEGDSKLGEINDQNQMKSVANLDIGGLIRQKNVEFIINKHRRK